MKVIGAHPELLSALVRYVEAKCLVAGTTTTQGIALFSAPGIRRYYRGITRNVEETHEPALPEAVDRIPDVDARQLASFQKVLDRQTVRKAALILHLSEGTNPAARAHFLALEGAHQKWAISPALVGIHCVALADADIDVLAAHGGAMVWSPLSNLLLYGHTAPVAKLKAAGVRMGLGPDWSPSGSKNLLGELKVAHLYSRQQAPAPFDDAELVAMATCTAAEILGWEAELGSLEAGKKADLVAVAGAGGDAYATSSSS
jgi:5-methylthioadenosine/S-adenosylhomocysteine deaminase